MYVYHCNDDTMLELVADEGFLSIIVRMRQFWNLWLKIDIYDHNNDGVVLTHVEGWRCMLTRVRLM